MLHTFVALVDDKPGTLTRVASLLRHLDVNIGTAKDGQLAISGLKARATLAWGNAPGHRPTPARGLKARAKRLVPHKLFLKRNAVLPEHRSHLGLKITTLVMGGLRIDVTHQRGAVAQPNRKRRIPALPAELRELRSLRLDPFGRRDLQSLNYSRDRFGSSEEQRDVNVVGNAANPDTTAPRAIENRSEIGMHLRSNCVFQKRTPVLGAEYQVDKNIREGLRHGSEYSAGLQPANIIPTLTWGAAPGYDRAGLQPAAPLPIKSSFERFQCSTPS